MSRHVVCHDYRGIPIITYKSLKLVNYANAIGPYNGYNLANLLYQIYAHSYLTIYCNYATVHIKFLSFNA